MKQGQKCSFGGIHKSCPSSKELEHDAFKRIESKFGKYEPGKFKYDKVAAPAKPKTGTANADNTPPGSPRSAAGSAAH